MVRRSAIAMALGVVMALVWSSPALAAVNTTLTLSGISGPGPKYAPVMTLQSYTWGSGGSHTGGYTGKALVRSPSVSGGEFSVGAASDKSIVNLALVMTDGRQFATATLSATHVPDSGPYFRAVFSQVFVESISILPRSFGSDVPGVHITFAYQSVNLEYTPASTCSLGSRTWLNLSRATPAVDPALAGTATDSMQPFLPVQLGVAGPGQVAVGAPSQADTLLGANGANGISNLRAQTLATRLDIGDGSLDQALVSSQLTQADQYIGADKPSAWGSLDPSTQSSINQLVSQLAGANTPATGCPLVPQGDTLTPPPTPALAGLVTDACTGAPVNGLTANLTAPGLPGPITLLTGNNEFEISTLAAGTYQLNISGSGHTTFTLPAVQIPAAGAPPQVGAFAGGLQVAVAMAPTGGCAPGKTPVGPASIQALNGGLFDKCTLMSLNGGSVNLVPPAGGTIPAIMRENGFTLAELAAGTYGLSESVSGYQQVQLNGGTLPAVQMPGQPAMQADGSGARFAIIAVLEPVAVGAAC